MARKPIELERSGMLTPRERLWAAARKLRSFTLVEWQDATKPVVLLQTCETYLDCLVAGGYLKSKGPVPRKGGDFAQVTYELVKDTLDAPRLDRKGRPVTQGNVTLAMWRAMNVLKTFDWHDIQRAASLPNAPVPANTASSYVKALATAGYFQTLQPSKPGTAARFRLVRRTGAHAPAITRRKTVFDRNKGEFAWQESEQEVVDGLDE